MEKINKLGAFADLSAVWDKHPEGGRDGDYITIGTVAYYWDDLSRQWVRGSGEGGSSYPSSQTIDGDLTVGGNLRVAGDAEFEGDVTINGELHLPNGDRYKGQSSYKSLVFTRADERPNTPTGGSYNNPLPDGNDWKDGIPPGNKPIWMSSRVFTSDGSAPQTSSWTVPMLMSDAENIDVEFSPQPTTGTPVPPIEGVNGNLGWLWFDPVRNPNADWDKMNWMATRTKSVASNGSAVWSEWTIILIKGENGDGVQSVFTVTNGYTPSISGSGYPPSGWYKSVDTLTVNQGDVLWMSERRFENGAWSAWSAPIRLNGVDGLPGEDGTDIEFIYKRMNRLPNSNDSAPSNQQNQDDYVPRSEGWDDNPSGVTADAKYEWACQRTKQPGDSQWSEWVGPFVWSAFGERGMDGDGVEYVFIRTTVFTPPTITESAVQEAERLPEVANYTSSYDTGEIDGNTFFDNPKGVNPTWLYEWVSKRKKVNGVWGTFSSPGLWATYSEQHTIDIDPVTGCWIIDGHLTDKKAIGTGVTVRGRVDVYLDTDKTETSQKSLESYPLDLGDLEVGDCWIVENGTGVAGHLFLCVATTGTMSTMWQDLGEFKGEPGQSQYMHIAWASKINFTGNPQQFSSAENFTKNYVAGQSYDWMGVTVDANESDATLEAVNYKWNYLKGKDGSDVEYVYLRTKVNTAPTITEAAVQTPERYPAVANYEDYTAGDAEHDTFTDDPNGVTDTWKYEWVSRREKSYNANTGKMEWGAFLSPARLWSNWADPGAPGESATIIKPSVAQIVIDASASGDVPLAQQSQTVFFRLFYGDTQVTPTSYSATFGGATVSNIHLLTTGSDPRVSVAVAIPSTGATTKDIVVEMSYGTHSASTTVPVIINRAGQNGRDVYKSIVFMRSSSKPTKPGNNDGSYNSPVPTGTYSDNGTTRSWDDGVEPGTLPVWMTSRIFSSDNQSPPQESSWNDVVLMQDTDLYDVEFTDADPESSPGTPDNPASGVTWYDPVNDASYLSTHAMNWMAQRVKVVTSTGTSWGSWVVNRIRGEKGNDGAGQAYVRVNISQVVIDCDSTGKPKTAKTGDNAIVVNAQLYWGDNPCSLITVTPVGGGNYSIISVDCDGFNLPVPGQTGSTYQITKSSSNIEVKLSVKTSAAISSGNINFTLVGTDANNVEHVATLTVPIIANIQGATGATGSAGPVLRFRGVYSSDVDQSNSGYVWNDTYRDCVKFEGTYYLVNTSSNGGTQLGTPPNSNWMSGGDMKFFATELLLAENGVIELLSTNKLIFTDANGHKTAGINEDGEGSHVTYYTESPYGKRKDDNADGWTYYYNNDADNTLAWMLGPSGVIIKTGTVIKMDRIRFSTTAVGNTPTYSSGSNLYTITNRWVYSNENSGNNGKVYKSDSLDASNEPSGALVESGTYAQASEWLHRYNKDLDKFEYYLPLITIGTNGKISGKREATYVDPNDPLNE